MTRTQSQKKRARQARANKVAQARTMPPAVMGGQTRRKAAKPKRTVNVNMQNRVPGRAPTIGLSECARDYMSVLLNPFSGKVACVPTGFNVPSEKFISRTRGVFTTGTGNYGVITVAPFPSLWGDTNTVTGGSKAAAIIMSTGAWAGTTVPGYGDGGVQAAGTNSVIATTQQPAAAQQRLVACGLRVRNITPMQFRGGQVVGAEAPGHITMVGMSISAISNLETSATGNIDGAWNTIVYHPIDDDESNYYSGNAVPTNATVPGAGINSYVLSFMVAAPAGQAQSYEFEVSSVSEVVGTIGRGLTPSYNDAAGYAMVANSFATSESRKPFIGDTARSVVKAMGQMAGVALREAAQSFVYGVNSSSTPRITQL